MSEPAETVNAAASSALDVGQLQYDLGPLSLPHAFSGSVAELPDPSELARSLYGPDSRTNAPHKVGLAAARSSVAPQPSPATAPPARRHDAAAGPTTERSYFATSQATAARSSSDAAGAAPARPAPPLPSSPPAPSIGLRASAAAAEEMLSRRIDDLQRQFHEARVSDRMELRRAVDRLTSWLEDTVSVAPARSDIVGAAELRQLREENSSLRTSLEEMQDRVEHLELQMRDVGKLQAVIDGDALGRWERRMDEQGKEVKELRESLRHTQRAAHGALRQVALRSESRWSRFADGLRALVPSGRDDDASGGSGGEGTVSSASDDDGGDRRRHSRRRRHHSHHSRHRDAEARRTRWGQGSAASAVSAGQGAGDETLNVSDLLPPPPARSGQDYDAVDALNAALRAVRSSVARAEDAAADNGERLLSLSQQCDHAVRTAQGECTSLRESHREAVKHVDDALAARDKALEERCGALEGRVQAVERRCEETAQAATGGSEHVETLRRHAAWVQDRVYALQASDAGTTRSVALLERRLNAHDASAELQSQELQGVKRRLMEGLRLIASQRGGATSNGADASRVSRA